MIYRILDWLFRLTLAALLGGLVVFLLAYGFLLGLIAYVIGRLGSLV